MNNQTHSKLDNCPFCGSNELLKLEEHMCSDGSGREGWIECENCCARGPTIYGSCDFVDMEIMIYRDWNMRFPDDYD